MLVVHYSNAGLKILEIGTTKLPEARVKITYESVREFARKHGQVTFWTVENNSLTIGGKEPDFVEIVETAPTIAFQGNNYTREQFERIMTDYGNKPKGER
jgi:hypothetical protein